MIWPVASELRPHGRRCSIARGSGSHAPAGGNLDRLLARFLVRRMLDQGDEPALHEAPGAHRRPAACHLADLDDAARRRDLDPTAGTGRDDVEGLRATLPGVDHGLDAITLHALSGPR